ncbi:hypothetical protein TL16_g05197 [Triparma laevis f. inornata]|uniref:Serine aminopeptidase S33 domain-containing protein n=1 Tax=Triparma laevis f. inornata TaxID=1714386 RepID=A0A9W7E947_9STRA|nr:hypothetical protein TL16_g05197 [Triparma laevis f. inornata]
MGRVPIRRRLGLSSIIISSTPVVLRLTHPTSVAFFASKFSSAVYKTNDSGEARRKLWAKMISDPATTPDWFATPKDIAYEEKYWVNSRGMCLMSYVMKPIKKKPKTVIMFCHGYSDQSCWMKMAEYRRLVRAGYAVMALEYEGHGRSDGLLVSVPDWDKLIGDVSEFMFEMSSTVFPGLPLFVAGESMGGAVSYEVSQRCSEIITGTLLLCPMCAIHENMKPSPLIIKMFYAVVGPPGSCNYLGTLPFAPSKDVGEYSFKSKDKKDAAEGHCNFFGRKPRLATARELLDTTDRISASLKEFDVPFVVLHGKADLVTDPNLSQRLFDESCSKDKTIKLYDGMWHTLTTGAKLGETKQRAGNWKIVGVIIRRSDVAFV